MGLEHFVTNASNPDMTYVNMFYALSLTSRIINSSREQRFLSNTKMNLEQTNLSLDDL